MKKLVFLVILILAVIVTIAGIVLFIYLNNTNQDQKEAEILALIKEEDYSSAYNYIQDLLESKQFIRKKALIFYYQAICLFMKKQENAATRKLDRTYKINSKFDRLCDIDAFNDFFEKYKRNNIIIKSNKKIKNETNDDIKSKK
ncbi:MAG: hypothetical protein KAT05_02755 [Spirochaetes bacterium]|nr:hypothetical protein [Spirochaetota bacterium]